jgi:membrane-bound lytic murein transglycosylase A
MEQATPFPIILNLASSERVTTSIFFLFLLYFCSVPLFAGGNPPPLGHGYEFPSNGKASGPSLLEVYTRNELKTDSVSVSPSAHEGARQNVRYLNHLDVGKAFAVGNLVISGKQLRSTGRALDLMLKENPQLDLRSFSLQQLQGEDGFGNVHFTGYYTPLLEARHEADGRFRFPVYALPPKSSTRLPSREAIDYENALGRKNLELAFAEDFLDVYFLHVQGSGVLRFPDGSTRLLGYKGVNGHPYFSIGRFLVQQGFIPPEKISLRSIRAWFQANPDQMKPILNKNRSYTFFTWRTGHLMGAAGLPLTAGHSVAVDPKFIPYGACLLGEIPVLDEAGELVGHRWDLLFAHDTGGAIKGPGHLDLYHGLGRKAGENAGDLHHYGRLWLLLLRDNP